MWHLFKLITFCVDDTKILRFWVRRGERLFLDARKVLYLVIMEDIVKWKSDDIF